MGYDIQHPVSGHKFFVSTKYIGDNKYHYPRRRKATDRKYLVVHHTAGNTAGDLTVLRGKTSRKVSVKYLIPDPQDTSCMTRDGRFIIYQLLAHDVPGYSVGSTTGKYGYVDNYNSDSIEVSNLGNGVDKFEGWQVLAVEALAAYEERRTKQQLVLYDHKTISPGRKFDIHPSFPLLRVQRFVNKMRYGRKV